MYYYICNILEEINSNMVYSGIESIVGILGSIEIVFLTNTI